MQITEKCRSPEYVTTSPALTSECPHDCCRGSNNRTMCIRSILSCSGCALSAGRHRWRLWLGRDRAVAEISLDAGGKLEHEAKRRRTQFLVHPTQGVTLTSWRSCVRCLSRECKSRFAATVPVVTQSPRAAFRMTKWTWACEQV